MNESVFRFPNSKSLLLFSSPLPPEAITFEKAPLFFSNNVLAQLNAHWLMQLKKKQQQLSDKGISSEIKPYLTGTEISIDALFVNDKPVMWPGSCVTLRNWSVSDTNARLIVSDISYPFISALGDPHFLKNLSDQNLHSIRPPLAICTFAITSDNFLVLTVRGISTNVYPGRLYGQGGNPEEVEVNLLQHQLEEMEEELLVKPEEVIQDSMQFFGMVEDEENFPRKPDLIGTVQISLSSQEVKKQFETRSPDQRPADVADIRFVKFDEESLMHFLRSETQPKDFCPPAHGGLFLVGLHYFGISWFKEAMKT